MINDNQLKVMLLQYIYPILPPRAGHGVSKAGFNLELPSRPRVKDCLFIYLYLGGERKYRFSSRISTSVDISISKDNNNIRIFMRMNRWD